MPLAVLICLLAMPPDAAGEKLKGQVVAASALLGSPAKLRPLIDTAVNWDALARASAGASWTALDNRQRTDFARGFRCAALQGILTALRGAEPRMIVGVVGARESAPGEVWASLKLRAPFPMPSLVSFRYDAAGKVIDVRYAAFRLVTYAQTRWQQALDEHGSAATALKSLPACL